MKRSSKGRKTPKTPGTTENLGRMTPGTDIGRGTLTTPGGVTIKPPTRAWKEPVQKNTRVPGNWPEKRSYRPRLVSRDVTRRMVHDPLDFLSSSGGEPRLRTAPMNPKMITGIGDILFLPLASTRRSMERIASTSIGHGHLPAVALHDQGSGSPHRTREIPSIHCPTRRRRCPCPHRPSAQAAMAGAAWTGAPPTT